MGIEEIIVHGTDLHDQGNVTSEYNKSNAAEYSSECSLVQGEFVDWCIKAAD